MVHTFFLFASDADLSVAQNNYTSTATCSDVPEKKTGVFFVNRKASNTPTQPPLPLLHQLDVIY